MIQVERVSPLLVSQEWGGSSIYAAFREVNADLAAAEIAKALEADEFAPRREVDATASRHCLGSDDGRAGHLAGREGDRSGV